MASKAKKREKVREDFGERKKLKTRNKMWDRYQKILVKEKVTITDDVGETLFEGSGGAEGVRCMQAVPQRRN